MMFSNLGENMVKGARGAKIKVLCQGPHMTHVIFVWIYNFKFCIWSTPFNTKFRYKYILTTNSFYTMYIMHSCPLSHKHEQLWLKVHFQNP